MFTLISLIAFVFPFSIATAITVPEAPTIGPAWSVRDAATVTFAAPASDGGSVITGYTVTSSPAGGIDSNAGTTDTIHIITGLTNGTSYEFSVTADNIAGSSSPSGLSNPVIARPYAPTTGTINNLVVFIRFSDQPEFTQPFSYYDGLFNSDSKSLKNFYLESSYNTLTVDSTFYPSPSDGAVVSYQDAYPTTYYLPYDETTNPGGYQGSEGIDRETDLVTNALNAINALIPGGLDLDTDSDGYIDHIAFEVYSTALNTLPAMFYSRATFDLSGGIVINGKQVGSYTWVTASQDDPESYIASTEIHEMGHSFGYPDLRNNGERSPVGVWDVMSLALPAHSGAYMKNKFTGWIAAIPEITIFDTYTINDITQSTDNSYKIRISGSNEFLVLEYRKAAGQFESNLPGSGLCISRVNESAGMWANLSGPPFFMYYFRTDGTTLSDGVGDEFQCLNSESGRIQFNDFSNPACFLSDGSPCGISIDNIGSASGVSTTFSFIDPATTIVTHLISGRLAFGNGSAVSGATVTLSGDAAGVKTTGPDGTYFFIVTEAGDYTVTPAKANVTFSPINSSFSNVIADNTQDFAATTIPGAPTSVSASAGNGQATITFTAPAWDGGSAITGYTVTSSPAGGTDSNAGTTATSHVVTGLTNGTEYTFTVTASNTVGTSVDSTASSPVTPKGSQTISFGVLAGKTYGAAPFTVSATATSGLTITFTSATTDVCTTGGTNGSTVTIAAAGTCTIAADQAGNSTYSAAVQVSQSFTVGKASQTIGTISFTPATFAVGGTTTASVTATSGLEITFTSTTTSKCTVSGSTVTAVTAGTCTIAANQAGNANYNAATQVTRNITVSKASQSIGAISFSPDTLTAGGTTTVSGTATSGLTVTFTSTTTAICTVSGSVVTGKTVGTCTIAANQVGNTNYNAAAQVTQNITVSKGTQTIGAMSLSPATLAVAGTTTVSATATSALTVTFTSTTTGVCTVLNKAITGVTAGTCTIAADQAGNASYFAATQVTQNFTVAQASQVITFAALGGKTYGAAPFTVNGTGGASGNPVLFSSTTPEVCTAGGTNGKTITIAAAGTCTIAADQAGNANYSPAIQVTRSFTVGKASQAIIIGTISGKTYGAAPFTVNATGGDSDNPVTFSSTTSGVCTTSGTNGSTVTIVGGGTCKIAANQAGNTDYAAAPQVTKSITVGKAPQTVVFDAQGNQIYGAEPFTVSATGGASGNPVTFSSVTPVVCTTSGTNGSTVTIVGGGTCKIAANQAGNTNYSAAVQVTQNITVNKKSQSIGTISFAPATLAVGGKTTASATATTGLAVAFTSKTTGVCTVSGFTVTAVTAGTCTIAADQTGNTNYAAAPQVTQDITVDKGSQSIGAISFTATVAVGGKTTVSAKATTGLAVTFTSTTTEVCTVSSSTVTAVTAGTCTIAANQTGSANYAAAPQVTRSITVGKGNQTIGTISFSPATITSGQTTTVKATATSGLDVIFTSSTTGICTVSGSTVTGVKAGTCTILASNNGNVNYNAAAQVKKDITIGKGSQDIGTISFSPATLSIGQKTTVSATATSGLPVTFTSTTTGVCTVSDSTVTGVTAGTCTIAANQAGNANYNAAKQITQGLTVGQASQTIVFGPPGQQTYGVATFTVSATGGASGNPVTFSSTTPGVCTTGGTNGSTVTIAAVGICTIAADQAGNTNYSAATQVTQSITIGQASQVIKFVTVEGKMYGAAPFSVSATGGASGNPVSFSSTTPEVCTAKGTNGSTVTIVAVGTCTLAADQDGDSNYSAASQVTQSFTVGQASQVISFGALGGKTYGTAPFKVRAKGGASGNPVSFSSATTGVCTIGGKNGNTVTIVAAGTCTIAADQAGNTNYAAATQVTQEFTVAQVPQSISFKAQGKKTFGAASFTVSAKGGRSGNPVTFSSTTPEVCTSSGTNGSTITAVAAGTCTIAANQAGNASYIAAPQVTQNITVTKINQSIKAISFSPANLEIGSTTVVSATATSGLEITFTSTTTDVCTLNGSTVIGVKVGKCAIAANQAGNATYSAAAQVIRNITVGKESQSIETISFSPETLEVSGTTTVSATATSGLTVTFTSTTTRVCRVSDGTVTGVTAGTCTIAANQAGNAGYSAAEKATQNITVGKGNQSIETISISPETLEVGGRARMSATTTSGLAVTFTSTTTDICKVSGRAVTGITTGTCTIAADQAGNANYNPATQITQRFTVGQASQTIVFRTPGGKTYGAVPFTVRATGGRSSNPVTFSSTTSEVCTTGGANGSTITIVAAGTCTIAANQAGNTNYSEALQVMKDITVGKGNQRIGTIRFSPATLATGGTTTVSATATSGLAVTFTSTTTDVCTVSGNAVTSLKAGKCKIKANQDGDANYKAAAKVIRNITVGRGSQRIGTI